MARTRFEISELEIESFETSSPVAQATEDLVSCTGARCTVCCIDNSWSCGKVEA